MVRSETETSKSLERDDIGHPQLSGHILAQFRAAGDVFVTKSGVRLWPNP